MVNELLYFIITKSIKQGKTKVTLFIIIIIIIIINCFSVLQNSYELKTMN